MSPPCRLTSAHAANRRPAGIWVNNPPYIELHIPTSTMNTCIAFVSGSSRDDSSYCDYQSHVIPNSRRRTWLHGIR